MSKQKKPGRVQARIVKARNQPIQDPVKKSDTSTQIARDDVFNASDWIQPPVRMEGYERMVTESSILPQCIRAYKNNIAGFGIGVRYSVDQDETPEMAAEYTRAEEIIELLNVEQDTKEVFEDVIEARETFGISYIEVIRNLAGEVVQIEFVQDIPSMVKTDPLEPYVNYSYFHNGEEIQRRKKFRKYRQQIGGKTVYFKEFGDPRVMDNRTGKYAENGLELQYQANEIMEFAIGTKPYGEVRWIGQILGVDGSRRAENLNNNYFINGRHTPLMILVKGGTLTDDSFEKLTQYMEDIKGENGQHAFIVLEAENAEQRTDFDTQDKPEIEVKDIASILQKDELFQDYLDNNRRRVQSSFQLPDLYVGYTTDFNRATAQTAQEVTEEQVFQPERKSLAWAINNRLLNSYRFRYVEVYFKEPDVTNPDDLYKIMSVVNNAGGLTPNDAREVLYNLLGESCEEFQEEWGNTPIAISKNQQTLDAAMGNLMTQITGQIEKSQAKGEPEEIVAVMKSVRKLLGEMQKQGGAANEA